MSAQSLFPGWEPLVKPFRFPPSPHEWKIVPLRECPMPEKQTLCDTPDLCADYWRAHVVNHPYFNPEVECMVVLILNSRRRVKGHHLVATGLVDQVAVLPREVFRLAVMTAAVSIVVMHNHPSGDPAPSESDIRVTRDLIRAGQLLKIEVCDHVIVGAGKHASLREMGYFGV